MNDDETPPLFDVDDPNRWGLIQTAFQVAGFLFGPPIALHILRPDGSMTYVVGVLTGTEDTHARGSDVPTESLFYFQDAEVLTINWSKTAAVLAMVSTIGLVEPA